MRLILVAAIMLTAACADSTASDRTSDDLISRPARSLPSSLPSTSSSETSAPPASNRDALAGGISMLRNGSVREIAEAEPPDGDTDAELIGRWDGHVVVAHVAPEGSAMVVGEVVAVDEIAGVQVETVTFGGRTAPVLRFAYGAFDVDFQVLSNDLNFLRRDSFQLLGVILCPSECGDLPPGADG